MVDGGGGTPFPVIFFDGEREIHIGNIQVHPMLDYKTFQFMLSQRIGISPNQISIYLIDRKNSNSSSNSKSRSFHSADDRRKVPITGKANFALICRTKNSCILVVLKRSRKARSRKLRSNGVVDYAWENDYVPLPPPENVILLRRNQPLEANFNHPNYASPLFYDQIAPADLASLNERLQTLRLQRENYAAAARVRSPDSDRNDFPKLEEIYNSMTMTTKTEAVFSCNECKNLQKNGNNTASFHLCSNDDVVVGFRAWAGPIGSPFR